MAIRKKIPQRKPKQQSKKQTPAPKANASKPSVYSNAQTLGQRIGANAGTYGKTAAQIATAGPIGVIEGLGSGLESGFLGTSGNVGGNLAKFGALGTLSSYLAPKVIGGIERMMESPEQKQTRIHTEDEKKYRKKMYDQIMGGRTDNFEEQDLDTADAQQDAGWRGAFDKVDFEKYSKVAAESIKANDPTAVWNMMVRQAQADGKKINTSKPLYLPNTFTKGGQKYAYAIDASERDEKTHAPKLRYVPIKIGGKPFEEDESAK